MIKGLYSSYAAMESAWHYQEMLANNISNSSTIGYKREVASQQAFRDVLLSQQSPVPAPLAARVQAVVGQIGNGKFVAEFATDFAEGSFQGTGEELDFALEDGFFSVRDPEGNVFHTRDGRFNRDAAGDLVTSHGYYVLGADGQPINLPVGGVTVATDGTMYNADEEPVARLSVVDFAPGSLERAGEAYFSSEVPGVEINGTVRQGFLEGSNTNMAEELTSLMTVHRVYQANQTVLSRLNTTLEQASGELGRLT